MSTLKLVFFTEVTKHVIVLSVICYYIMLSLGTTVKGDFNSLSVDS